MIRCISFLVIGVMVGLLPRGLSADTWCSTARPNAVFCDDFDRYCANPPPAPQECPDESPDANRLRSVWGFTTLECSTMLVDSDSYTSPPFAGRVTSQELSTLLSRAVDLRNYCAARFGAGYNSVLATDLNPLQLEFIVYGGTSNKILHNNSFMELSFGSRTSPQAPTDYILSANCSSCGGPDKQFPMICQQNNPPAGCPPINTAPHKSGIAVGINTYLDNNPCHCGGNPQAPTNTHLSFFDGHRWWILTQGLFPGGGTNGPIPGDFLLRNRNNHVRLTIKSSTAKVELTCTDPNPDEYSWCEIPLDYLGPYNMLFVGSAVPCRLKLGQWECQTDIACIKGAPGGGNMTYDNVALQGGQGNAAPGVCCFPDTSCTMMYGADCAVLGGEFQGSGTNCATTPCCPFIEPDHDNDGDADQSDFGWFQTCLSGYAVPVATFACRCADFNDDGFVDQTDLGIFLDCVSGQGIPVTAGCDD